MPQTSRTFRIFVSSTFSDLKEERNALQERVFPRLRDLASAHGCRFQAIDLRWGVSEEAALDQQTMKICLGEIARCQTTSPRPNFIILLGDRYGWRPLPCEIPADEFEQIVPLTAKDDKVLLEKWYRRDENAVPPVYCLQPRSGEFVEADAWEKVETHLHQVLQSAVEQLSLPPERALKYTASATEQEIAAGALQVEDGHEHVFGYFREIEDLPEDESSRDYREADPQAGQMQTELKDILRKKLAGNVHDYKTRWQEDGPAPAHLDQLCEDVYADLSKIIRTEVDLLETVDPLDREIEAHEVFGRDRARVFIGRGDILKAISDYIAGSDSHPLVVWGESGCGKSALMAKAVEQAGERCQNVISRFIGATPESSSSRTLLESLCQQISKTFDLEDVMNKRMLEAKSPEEMEQIKNEYEIPSGFEDLVKTFQSFIGHVPVERKLILFVDALDQLVERNTAQVLKWLPVDLPPNLRLIVSTLPGDFLKSLVLNLPPQNRINIRLLSADDGKSILNSWFEGIHRKLQGDQEGYLLDRFGLCGLPLYLKLAFEEARLWKSFDTSPYVSEDIPGILGDLFTRLSQESYHGKELVSRSLGYLAAAKNGLSEDELLDILSGDNDLLEDFQRRFPKSPLIDRLPVVVWSRLYFDLEPYLHERAADGTNLLAFYHRQISEAAIREFLIENVKGQRHQALARYFGGKPLRNTRDNENITNLRKLTEQPYQQVFAEYWEDVKVTLTDFDFLEAKLSSMGPFPLLDDYDLTLEASSQLSIEMKPLALIRDTFLLASRILARDSKQISGQLLGRLRGVENPEIKDLLKRAEAWKGAPWLCPLNACLTAPGGPLLYTLQSDQLDGVWSVMPIGQDGSRVISFSWRCFIIWDLAKGNQQLVIPNDGPPGSSFSVGAVSPKGDRAISGSNGGIIKIWDLESGRELFSFKHENQATKAKNRVNTVLFSPDGNIAISGAGYRNIITDNTIKVWDLKRGREKFSLTGHSKGITCLANVFGDGKYMISGSFDGTFRLWDIEQGRELCGYPAAGGEITSIRCVGPDKSTVVIQSKPSNVQVWNLKKMLEMAKIYGRSTKEANFYLSDKHRTRKITLSEDGNTAIYSTVLYNGNDQIAWNLTSNETHYFSSDMGSLITMTPDGRRAIFSSAEGVRVMDLVQGKLVASGNIKIDGWKVMVADDGQRILSWLQDTIKVWDPDLLSETDTKSSTTGKLNELYISPDGSCALAGAQDASVTAWDVRSNIELYTLEGAGRIQSISPDSRFVLTLKDQAISVWDIESGNLIRILSNTTDIKTVKITPDGHHILAISGSDSLKLWDMMSGQEVGTCREHENINDFSITPDGRYAISQGGPGFPPGKRTYMVWDLSDLNKKGSILGFGYLGAISLDSRFAAFGWEAYQIRLWDIRKGELLCAFEEKGYKLAITPDSRYLISGYPAIRMFDIESGKLLWTAQGGSMGSPFVTNDGRYLIFESWRRTGLPIYQILDIKTGEYVHRNLRGTVLGVTPDCQCAMINGNHHDLRIIDLEDGNTIASFSGEENLEKYYMCQSGEYVIANDYDSGHVYVLKLKNMNFGTPIISAWENKELQVNLPNKERSLAFRCPHCFVWTKVAEKSLGTETSCLKCGISVKLNPFTIEGDWEPIAEAWKKRENKK
ncbi:MAG: DUF4062 domain-containing protein [Anaerolineales bacterium]|nr:DUF4062 domain-containing protein [Anaerolineales bacterium]